MAIRKAVPSWLKKRLKKGASTLAALAVPQLTETVKVIEAKVEALSKRSEDLDFLYSVAPKYVGELYPLLKVTPSQNRQDLFVLAELGLKRDGFFVEFGAANGIDASNTYLLETAFGWRGILAEPAQSAHAILRQNRKCIIDTRCVWKATGDTLQFREATVVELSTIETFTPGVDEYWLRNSRTYGVKTVSLNDLLSQHNAPAVIDFLSIDTEGSEFDILSAFDFSARRFRTIVCEHAWRKSREEICELLTSKGYKRKFEQYSGWDDWYISE